MKGLSIHLKTSGKKAAKINANKVNGIRMKEEIKEKIYKKISMANSWFVEETLMKKT